MCPLQVGYKNYVGSVGAEWEPLLITDRTCSPPEFARDYSEHLVILPRSFYVTEDYEKTHPECLAAAAAVPASSSGFDIQAIAAQKIVRVFLACDGRDLHAKRL
jgi:predicted O-linked N-acetylglucosamine transferase (SPINDLY family)